MARYKRANQYPLTQQQKEAVRYHRLYQGGQMNDMKYVLLRDMQTFAVYMGWYNLEKGLYTFLSVHELAVFGHTVCKVCNAPQTQEYFDSKLSGRGEDPENPSMTEKESLLAKFAEVLMKDPHDVPEALYEKMNSEYKEPDLVKLIAFAFQLQASCRFEAAVMHPDD